MLRGYLEGGNENVNMQIVSSQTKTWVGHRMLDVNLLVAMLEAV